MVLPSPIPSMESSKNFMKYVPTGVSINTSLYNYVKSSPSITLIFYIPSKWPKGWVPVNLALGSALNYSIIFTTLSIIYLCLINYKNSDKSPTDYD